MIKTTLTLSTLLILFGATLARADEIDFYRITTRHSPYAASGAFFRGSVVRTSAIDSSVLERREYRCAARSEFEGHVSCETRPEAATPRERWPYLPLTQEGAARLLAMVEPDLASRAPVIRSRIHPNGTFEFVFENDEIWHVNLPAPIVADDSMVCDIGVRHDEADSLLANVFCRSEFYPEHSFLVRDVPASLNVETNHSGEAVSQDLVLGSPYYTCFRDRYRYRDGDWRTGCLESFLQYTGTTAKLAEIITGIHRLKHASLSTQIDTSKLVAITIPLEEAPRRFPAARAVHARSNDSLVFFGDTLAIERVERIHRGADSVPEGRRGD